MTEKETEKLLKEVRDGSKSVAEALEVLRTFPYTDLGFARIDHHREMRTGYPEIVYCAGKTTEQVREIFRVMIKKENNIIGTRASENMFNEIKSIFPEAVYYKSKDHLYKRRKQLSTGLQLRS